MYVSVRRPLLTAIAAGILLCALWFVPSANATNEQGPGQRQSTSTAPKDSAEPAAGSAAESPAGSSAELALADTGSGVDTTPYLVGGTAFLLLGAAFVAHSVRRDAAGAL